ncbi:MAG: hypothetical protein IKU50_06245 [Bacteroidaceae bacterium]|nr:hypothetical protein [Bacteroidaceae bacterium]
MVKYIVKDIYESWLRANYSEKDKYFSLLIEAARKGSGEAMQYLKMILESTDAMLGHWAEKCLALLKPEDRLWLIDADSLVCDSIILAAMYKSYRHYTEHFVAEDTGEQVAIERTSIEDVPLFKRDAKFEQRVYETFCDVYMELPYILYKRILYMIAYTPLDTARLAYSRLVAEEKRIESGGCRTPYDEDICEELGYIYSSGWEEFGISIDHTKAKVFYNRAGMPEFGLTYDDGDFTD